MLFIKKGTKKLSVTMVGILLTILMITGIFTSSVYARDGGLSTDVNSKTKIEVNGNKVELSTEAKANIDGNAQGVVFILEDITTDEDGNVTAKIGYENNTDADIEITNILFNENIISNNSPDVLVKGKAKGAFEIIFKGDTSSLDIESSSDLNVQLIITAQGKLGVNNINSNNTGKNEETTSENNSEEDNNTTDSSTSSGDDEVESEEETTTPNNNNTPSQNDDNPNTTRETLPQTGDDGNMDSYILGGLIASLGVIILVLNNRNSI